MNNNKMKQSVWLIVALVILFFFGRTDDLATLPTTPADLSATTVEQLFAKRQSDVQVEVSGIVTRLLTDDNKGSRHQRFLIKQQSGHSLLIVHNIDLAPRIASLKAGDTVQVYGEYIWNNKGGLIHWTHHDPANRHPHGWIKHQDRLYQ